MDISCCQYDWYPIHCIYKFITLIMAIVVLSCNGFRVGLLAVCHSGKRFILTEQCHNLNQWFIYHQAAITLTLNFKTDIYLAIPPYFTVYQDIRAHENIKINQQESWFYV